MAMSEKCACSREKCDESCAYYSNIVYKEQKEAETKTED